MADVVPRTSSSVSRPEPVSLVDAVDWSASAWSEIAVDELVELRAM